MVFWCVVFWVLEWVSDTKLKCQSISSLDSFGKAVTPRLVNTKIDQYPSVFFLFFYISHCFKAPHTFKFVRKLTKNNLWVTLIYEIYSKNNHRMFKWWGKLLQIFIVKKQHSHVHIGEGHLDRLKLLFPSSSSDHVSHIQDLFDVSDGR